MTDGSSPHGAQALNFVRCDPDGNVRVASRPLSFRAASGAALWSASPVPHFVPKVGKAELRVIAVQLERS